MAYCEITQPLLQADEDSYDESAFQNDAHIEDSSSGYDSTDVSDSESDWPLKSRANVIPTNHVREEEVSARMKSTNALCESLKLIIDMPEICDVTFLVGSREVPVHGVRAILGTRSRVFYQLIIKHLNEREMLKSSKPYTRPYGQRLTIPVKKYGVDVFRMLIQFVHCGSVTITDKTVAGLLCGADQFQLRDLEQACWKYIDRRIELGCGAMILTSARAYSRHHRKATEICNDSRLYSAATHGIDDLLMSANQSGGTIDERKKIFSTQDHNNKHYVRSPMCWAYPLDLTAISPWNSQGHTRKAGVLITPRHAIWARHYSMKINTTLRFVDKNNNVIDRTITKTHAVPTEGQKFLTGHDIVVGELDQDVPAEITFVKVLPRNLTTIRTHGTKLPVFDTDFEEKALVANLNYENGNMVWLSTPSHSSIRYPYFETKITGDSGNPVFLVIDGELVLMFVFTYGGSGGGTSVTYQYDNINHILQQWASNYRLTEVDLSKFLDAGNNIPQIIG